MYISFVIRAYRKRSGTQPEEVGYTRPFDFETLISQLNTLM
jgi:hypothetical protein